MFAKIRVFTLLFVVGGSVFGAEPQPGDVLERLRSGGDLARAKNDLLRSLLADPKRQSSLYNLGSLAERERDWDAALDYYDRVVKAGPSSPVARAATERLTAVRRIVGLSATPDGREQLRYDVSLARASEAQASGRVSE